MSESIQSDIQSPRLRVAEVCSILRCSRDHLYNLNRRGRLRKYNDGPRFAYWLRDEVMAFATGKGAADSSKGA